MAIIIFQIALFFIITYVGYINRFRLNIVTAVAVIFTICMVKTSPLMYLQFLTIILAYTFVVRKGTIEEKRKEIDDYNKRKSNQLSTNISSNRLPSNGYKKRTELK